MVVCIPKPGEVTLRASWQPLPRRSSRVCKEYTRGASAALRKCLFEHHASCCISLSSLRGLPCRSNESLSLCYAGDPRCRCNAKVIEKYQKKLSGPFLDRLDLQVFLKPLTHGERFAEVNDGESAQINRGLKRQETYKSPDFKEWYFQ